MDATTREIGMPKEQACLTCKGTGRGDGEPYCPDCLQAEEGFAVGSTKEG